MFPNFSSDLETSSCRSTAFSAGITLSYNQQSPTDSFSSDSVSLEENTQELCTETVTALVPTVTAISVAPELQWLLQPTTLSPSPSSPVRPQNSIQATPKTGRSKGQTTRKWGETQELSPEEEEKKRIRRERNKVAAAKCRDRRRELTSSLQAETEKLEDDMAALQDEIASLLSEKEQLELILAAHKPTCKIVENLEFMFQESIGSPHSSPEMPRPPDGIASEADCLHDMDSPSFPTSAISGNLNILLCSSTRDNINELENTLGLKEEPFDDVISEMDKVSLDTTRSVPDIDLSSSLGVMDWETLYKSVSSDNDPLSTPVVTVTPGCSSFLSAFTFTPPEFDSLVNGDENHKVGLAKAGLAIDVLNSPTVLAL
ncbi:protein c-Fos-like [Brienomyrus brachyistius]|uniref:protein c-Fos-like n=1 Tax=Brienomyrus brachyistius TaxID=42636 RepID=UPI0020B43733|nr:protein c-Fos-like [Brienomyrus brachyistius]XP_048841175.1 protein c-Fos-like [Brienomyrus brachyistius]XP_048841176.1 protein c-Fos-like [Brienomyrus brachyistius]